jgi:hypothetical protein
MVVHARMQPGHAVTHSVCMIPQARLVLLYAVDACTHARHLYLIRCGAEATTLNLFIGLCENGVAPCIHRRREYLYSCSKAISCM